MKKKKKTESILFHFFTLFSLTGQSLMSKTKRISRADLIFSLVSSQWRHCTVQVLHTSLLTHLLAESWVRFPGLQWEVFTLLLCVHVASLLVALLSHHSPEKHANWEF